MLETLKYIKKQIMELRAQAETIEEEIAVNSILYSIDKTIETFENRQKGYKL